MKRVYAPGCALMLYKPTLAKKMLEFLERTDGAVSEHLVCCRHEPGLACGTHVINTCPGCDRRFMSLYDGVTTASVWEEIAECGDFPFPDYCGIEMAVHDSCPTRTEDRVHNVIRTLLVRMNIRVVEPAHTRRNATCCGDSFYESLPVDAVYERMKARAAGMPAENVAVYCLGCVRSMAIGGKKPRYMLDLLFGEETELDAILPETWHGRLKAFIESHGSPKRSDQHLSGV